MSRVVTPDSTTLTLDNGDMLTVRTRLNYGEWSDALVWASLPPTADGKMLVDPAKANLYLVIAYLLDWTLTDGDGARLPLRDQSKDAIAATLRHLDPDDVHEIKAAVDAHIARVQAEKKRAVSGAAA